MALCHINVGDWQWVNFLGPMDSTSASDTKDLEIQCNIACHFAFYFGSDFELFFHNYFSF